MTVAGRASAVAGVFVFLGLAAKLVRIASRNTTPEWLSLVVILVIAIVPAMVVLYGVLWLLWAVFHVLNLPPKGTVATISLVLTLVSFVLGSRFE